MPPWLPTAIIAGLCTSSAAVWAARLGRRPAAAEAPADPAVATPALDTAAEAPVPFVPPGAILFAAMWILYHLVGDVTAMIEGSRETEFDPDRTLLAMQQNCWLLGAMTCVAWMLLTRGDSGQLRTFGVARKGFGRQLWNGVMTVSAAWLPVFAVLLASQPLRTPDRQHSVFQLLELRPSLEIYAWAALTAVVIAPLFEELVFRVITQTWLEERLGRSAIIAASLIFAGVHRFPDSLAIIPLALVLGDAYQRRRSYTEVVVAHALFNAVMLALDATMQGQ